jgi:phosphatidylinositol dimannoside acyltransferase
LEAPSTLASPEGSTAAPRRRRWYTHRFNTPLSWELILRVTPKLPRAVMVPLHHLTTAVCFLCFYRERAASRRNLRRITGKTGFANLAVAYRLFYNFSRFMVGYAGLRGVRLEQFRDRLDGLEETDRLLRALIREGNGVIIATLHMGHWDLGLKLLSAYGIPTHVVMAQADPVEVTRYAAEARDNPTLRPHHLGAPMLGVELMLALKRGELVALQTDRSAGPGEMPVSFFGGTVPLPSGPVELAMATGAPILPIFILFGRKDRFRILSCEPLRFERGAVRRDPADRQRAMQQVAAMMESVISRYPDQWFNFYDFWKASPNPSGAQEGSHA